ncbi:MULTISPECIES: helix-turn-helix domain-containing protein [Streptomyces]|uniref:Helix-turn-helix transcriptional regulator n=1 Tax=Streptomyces doudnae TaxID=3075536 RepID=A0ABD5EZC5_9ACTN|nr:MULTISPECIES: helix-turn-helix transcriptional regulator [unclassified Streptomyces]MDT0440102.1 helix-turn-helix transcriptional regulator [Streptomyces sp. DSM 41981]MYQ66526.1 helix-turn-helix domain-containing protein [Streptomyces sp. SID4950]SCE21705.1 Helix-turn-helix domain-containing protein [Streptomyces sp. SolWspMP-5a-2]
MSSHAPNEARVIPLRGPRADPPAAPAPRSGPRAEPLWRDLVGDVLRRERLAQERTLKDVADAARISMPYLSEVERGRKEASSEVLAAAAAALGLTLGDLLALAHGELAGALSRTEPVRGVRGGPHRSTPPGATSHGSARRPAGTPAVPPHGGLLLVA